MVKKYIVFKIKVITKKFIIKYKEYKKINKKSNNKSKFKYVRGNKFADKRFLKEI